MSGKRGKNGEGREGGKGDPKLRVVPMKPGRKPHVPTQKDRTLVKLAVAGGYTREQIAKVVGIDVTTLRKYYKEELEAGDLEINLAIMGNLAQIARSPTHPKACTAAIFWAKTRMGWREPRMSDVDDDDSVDVPEFTIKIGDKGGG